MLHKLRNDLLAGMQTGSHEEERVHQLDHSVLIDVRSVKRHVRTRLHFTSESHIHSLFNVLRWGSNPDDGTPSIFSDAAHQLSNHMELGYLTHIVFRVLQTPRSDPTEASSYRVQARPTHASPTTHLPRISHVSPTYLPRISHESPPCRCLPLSSSPLLSLPAHPPPPGAGPRLARRPAPRDRVRRRVRLGAVADGHHPRPHRDARCPQGDAATPPRILVSPQAFKLARSVPGVTLFESAAHVTPPCPSVRRSPSRGPSIDSLDGQVGPHPRAGRHLPLPRVRDPRQGDGGGGELGRLWGRGLPCRFGGTEGVMRGLSVSVVMRFVCGMSTCVKAGDVWS